MSKLRRYRHRPLALENLEDRSLMASTVSFAEPTFNASELRDAVVASVFRFSGSEAFTVGFSASAGTATAGSDFQPTSGTLNFTVSEFEKKITVPILADTLSEPNETIQLALFNPTNGVTLDPNQSTAVATIIDDENLALRGHRCGHDRSPTAIY